MVRIALLFGVLSTGCFNNKAQLEEAAEFERRACACKEATCTDGVVKDLRIWFDKHKERRGTQADADAFERRMATMAECMVKVGMSEASANVLIEMGKEAEKL